MASISVEAIVEQASALTDVDDPDPTHFVDNLGAVVQAMNDEAQLTPGGLERFSGMLTVALRNRMEVDRYVADHPGIAESSLEPPIFLTGLPRSGTTYFQYLFDQDPDLRMLRTWEGDRPSPPPAVDPESARRATRRELRAGASGAGGDGRECDRRDAPHRRRRSAGVPGHPRPDLRQSRVAVDDVGTRLPRLPPAHRRPARRVRVPRAGAEAAAVGRARAAVDPQVAVPPARARRDRQRAPRRQVRGDAPRPGAGARLQLQPHAHAARRDARPVRIRSTSAATCSSSCDSTSIVWSHSTSRSPRRARRRWSTSTTTSSSTRPTRSWPTVFAVDRARVDADGRSAHPGVARRQPEGQARHARVRPRATTASTATRSPTPSPTTSSGSTSRARSARA